MYIHVRFDNNLVILIRFNLKNLAARFVDRPASREFSDLTNIDHYVGYYARRIIWSNFMSNYHDGTNKESDIDNISLIMIISYIFMHFLLD